MPRKLAAEFLGTAILVAALVGSVINASSSNMGAVTGLWQGLALAAALAFIIFTMGPVSGGHFNPAVSLTMLVRGQMSAGDFASYAVAQIAGGIAGCIVTNVMFGGAAISQSTNAVSGTGVYLGEVISTGGLLFTIVAITRLGKGHLAAVLVPVWLGLAYLFTSTNAVANPAVAIGRAFTSSGAGFASSSLVHLIVAEIVGALVGAFLAAAIVEEQR